MPEWALQLLVTGGGLGMMGAGANAWFKAWREDRKAKRDAEAAKIAAAEAVTAQALKSLQERNDKLEGQLERYGGKLESVLMDMIAAKEEAVRQMGARMEMDDRQDASIIASAEALKANAKMMADLKAVIEKALEPKA